MNARGGGVCLSLRTSTNKTKRRGELATKIPPRPCRPDRHRRRRFLLLPTNRGDSTIVININHFLLVSFLSFFFVDCRTPRFLSSRIPTYSIMMSSCHPSIVPPPKKNNNNTGMMPPPPGMAPPPPPPPPPPPGMMLPPVSFSSYGPPPGMIPLLTW